MSGNYKGPPFTRFPQTILEAIPLTKLSGNEIRILLVIARKTYGWGGEWDIIPYSQFEQMTMLPKDSVAKSFRRLVSKNVVELKNPKKKAWSPIRINPNFISWSGYTPPLPPISKNDRIKKINDDINKQTMVSTKAGAANDEGDNKNTPSRNNTHTDLYTGKHTKNYAKTPISIDKLKKGAREMHLEREKTGNFPEKDNKDEKQQSFLPPRDEEIVNRLVEAWNKIATGRIPKVKIIPQGSVRFKKALGQMNNKIFRENYNEVLKIITESPFLRGDISDFKATFDWILVEGNFIKISEGNFIKEEKNIKSDDSKPDKGRYHTGSGLKEVD